jgi:hypothetical protein
MSLSRTNILKLYRDLLAHRNNLKLTDKSYYLNYIRKQFNTNKDLIDQKKIERVFEVFDLKFFFKNCLLIFNLSIEERESILK